jgi:hypothetical protein
MWARVHKLDKVKGLPGGGAIIVIEDERSTAQMNRVPSLSTLIAIARVIGCRRALEAKFDGKGEVRYAAAATLPSFLSEAESRAGASVVASDGERVIMPAQASGVAALIDVAFAELAHYVRGALGVTDFGVALERSEAKRRANPLDKDKQPEQYWPAVLELAALAGERARKRGGRWVDTRELPLPFALKLADGATAHPTLVAQKIVEGSGVEESLAADKSGPVEMPLDKPADEPAP